MKKIGVLVILVFAMTLCLSTVVGAGKDADEKSYTLSSLTKKIEKLEKKEVTLSGVIVGVCKSGCKMWIAEGEFKEGDPFALVRAKDDAFKFDTKATGKTVVLHGYAVAKYMDYCAESGEEQEGAMDKCDTPVGVEKDKKKDAKKVAKKDAEKEAGKDAEKERTLKDVTFFATKVEYK